MKTRPVAPPVYRPQPVPKVLQAKANIKQPVGPGPQQHKPAVIQRSRVNVVQRDVDVAKAVKSENGEYLVDPRDTSVLYSEMRAPEPKPRGLYMRWIDRTVQHPRRLLYGWKPNVRFLSKAEQGASPSKSKPGSYEYVEKGLWDSVKSFSLRDLGRQLEAPPEVDRRPTVGVLGKNDCYAFADTLQNLIVTEAWEETGLEDTGRTKKTVHVTKPDSPADLTAGVGDMMRQIYQGSDCRYHAATVVAKDGKSLVTLEGHVSKDLQRPEFLIHNGVSGFADEPIRKGYGDEVEVTPLETLKWEAVASEREASQRRYERITGEDPTLAFHTAGSNLGVTPTEEVRRRHLASKRLRRQLRAIYEHDRNVHLENVRRAKVGEALIPVELSFFPPID